MLDCSAAVCMLLSTCVEKSATGAIQSHGAGDRLQPLRPLSGRAASCSYRSGVAGRSSRAFQRLPRPRSRWPQCADVVALGGFALFSVMTVRARKPSSGPRPREPRRRSVVRADFPRSARSGLSRGRRVSPQVRGGHPGAERCLRRHGRWELEACARALSARPRGLARAARPRGSEVRSSPGPATVRSLATSSPPLRGDHAPPRTRRGAQLRAGRAGPGRREAGGSVQKLDGSRRSWGPAPRTSGHTRQAWAGPPGARAPPRGGSGACAWGPWGQTWLAWEMGSRGTFA